jgi:hypothetical protein
MLRLAAYGAAAATLALLQLQQPAQAFYLPGVAPHEYKDGEDVRPPIFRRGLVFLPRPLLLGGAAGPNLCCRYADLSEGQQAVLDEDFAALRVLPPAVLQARHGALSGSASPDRTSTCLARAAPQAARAPAQDSSLIVHARATSGAGGKLCREPGRNFAGRSHRIVSLRAADEARRVLQGALRCKRVHEVRRLTSVARRQISGNADRPQRSS